MSSSRIPENGSGPSGGLPPGPAPATELDSAQAQKALQFMQGLIGQGISPATVDTFEETDTDSVFDTGHAAFMRGWDSAYANATSGPNALRPDQVGVEAPPAFQGQSGVGWSTLGGWGLFINPRTRDLPSGPNALRPDQVGVEAPPAFQGQSGVGWSTLGGWGLFINPRTRNLPAAL